MNVRGFAGGTIGAVNGIRPDGSVDTTSEQSAEVWVGTTYALAAFMLAFTEQDTEWVLDSWLELGMLSKGSDRDKLVIDPLPSLKSALDPLKSGFTPFR